MTRNRLASAALFIVTVIPIVVVNYYPVGDWMGGPLMILFILIPLSVVQLIVTILNFRKKENVKSIAALQTAIMLLCNGLMVYYIGIH